MRRGVPRERRLRLRGEAVRRPSCDCGVVEVVEGEHGAPALRRPQAAHDPGLDEAGAPPARSDLPVPRLRGPPLPRGPRMRGPRPPQVALQPADRRLFIEPPAASERAGPRGPGQGPTPARRTGAAAARASPRRSSYAALRQTCCLKIATAGSEFTRRGVSEATPFFFGRPAFVRRPPSGRLSEIRKSGRTPTASRPSIDTSAVSHRGRAGSSRPARGRDLARSPRRARERAGERARDPYAPRGGRASARCLADLEGARRLPCR